MSSITTLILNFLKKRNNKNLSISIFLVALVLITLPLKNIFVSISIIGFTVFSLPFFKKSNFKRNKALYIPILFFILMLLSLLWTTNFEKSLFGIQKQLPFLVIPITFFFIPKFKKEKRNIIFKAYSFSMVFYALFYLIRAVVRYIEVHNTNFFFYKELVPFDPGAIYMSVFASFALFYFIQIKKRSNLENISLNVLIIFIFLLSSKSIITVDFIIFLFYYAFFANIPKATKATTMITVSLFLICSVFFIKEVRERFLVEYETAFVDNTLDSKQNQLSDIHNISIKEAWHNEKFNKTDFLPGAALRVYQTRIFYEMLHEQNVFWKGFGLEASQNQISNKCKEHNLFFDYGNYNFHNQYIQTFAETGIFGFLVLIIMLFINLKNSFQNKNFLHIAFALTTIVLFLSESFFCRQRGIVFFIILYCLFNAKNDLDKKQL